MWTLQLVSSRARQQHGYDSHRSDREPLSHRGKAQFFTTAAIGTRIGGAGDGALSRIAPDPASDTVGGRISTLVSVTGNVATFEQNVDHWAFPTGISYTVDHLRAVVTGMRESA